MLSSADTPEVELIVGPYRAGKTVQVMQDLLILKKEQPLARVLVLVPSARYGQVLKGRLISLAQDLGSVGLFNVQIYPFYKACEYVLATLGKSVFILPKELRLAVVDEAINSLKNQTKLKHLTAIAGLPGTSLAVLKLIDELQRAGFSPEEVIAKLLESASSESRYLELAQLYLSYWSKLNLLGYMDQKQCAFALRELLASEPAFSLDWLIVDGFDRISRLQAEIVRGLACLASRTTITFDYILPHETEKNTRTEANNTNSLRKVYWQRHNWQKYTWQEYTWKESSYKELTRILTPKFSFVVSENDRSQKNVGGFYCLDRFLEMKEIARRCKEALLKGRSAGQILVVARDISKYRGIAEAAFEDAGLNYFIDARVELNTLPVTQLVMRLLRLALNNYLRQEVIACLRSPYFNLGFLGLTPKEVDVVDNSSYEASIVAGRDQWLLRLAKYKLPGLTVKLEKLFDLVTPPDELAPLSQHCTWAENVVADLVFLVDKHTKVSSTSVLLEQEALEGLRTAVRVLVLHERVLFSPTVNHEHFVNRLESLLNATTFPCQPSGVNPIKICSADVAPNHSFEELYVAGMVEGEFPRNTGESGFISSHELTRWSAYGIDLCNPRDESGFEQALFLSLLDRGRSKICFSFPQFDATGEELTPSSYLRKDQDGHESWLSLVRPYQFSFDMPVSPRDALAGLTWRTGNINIDELRKQQTSILDYWESIKEPLVMAYNRLQEPRENVCNGYLVDIVAANNLQITLPKLWSAKLFNSYGQCPFRFWVSHILKLLPRKEPQVGLTPKLKGELYHKVLELYFKELTNVPKQAWQARRDDILQDSFRRAIEWLMTKPDFQVGPYWDNEQKEMIFRLRRFVEKEANRLAVDSDVITPSMFEVKFGRNEEQSYPPLRVPCDQGEVAIAGIIDRIDLLEKKNVDGCSDHNMAKMSKIVDYKTGSAPISLADAKEGRNIQLALYALAVEQSILPGFMVSSGNYLSINSACSIGCLEFRREKTSDVLALTLQHICRTVNAVRSGNFTVSPQTENVCNNCDHRAACRILELRQLQQENVDNALAD